MSVGYGPQAPNPSQKNNNGLNLLLYVASFLLISAAAVFVAAVDSAALRVVCLWVAASLMYGVGLALARSKTFKPAGYAFLGTSIAILPFAGAALAMLNYMTAAQAWQLTSVIGMLFYLLAGFLLQSQIAAYLSMGFLVSVVLAGNATINMSVFGYLVVMMVFANVVMFIRYFAGVKIPKYFSGSFFSLEIGLPPLVFLASLILGTRLSFWQFSAVYLLISVQYFLNWLLRRETYQLQISRGVFTLALLFTSATFASPINELAVEAIFSGNFEYPTFVQGVLLVAILNSVVSLILYRQSSRTKNDIIQVNCWVGAMVALSVIMILIHVVNRNLLMDGEILIVISAIALVTGLVVRRLGWYWCSALSAVLIPATFIWVLSEPENRALIFSLAYLLLAFVIFTTRFVLRHKNIGLSGKNLAITLFWISAFFSFVASFVVSLVFLGSISLTIAVMAFISSYWGNTWAEELISLVLLTIGVFSFSYSGFITETWAVFTSVLVIYVVGIGLALGHRQFGETDRKWLSLITAQIIPLFLVLSPEEYASAGFLLAIVVSSSLIVVFRPSRLSNILAFATIYSYGLLAALILAGHVWLVIGALTLLAACSWLISIRVYPTVFASVGNGILAMSALLLGRTGLLDLQTGALNLVISAWICAAIFLTMYLIGMLKKSAAYLTVGLWSAIASLGFAALISLVAPGIVGILGGISLLLLGALGFGEAQRRHLRAWAEASVILAGFGIFKAVYIWIPTLPLVYAGGFFAAVLFSLAYLRWLRQLNYLGYEVAGVSILSFSSLVSGLIGGIEYQIAFLTIHIAALVIGVLLKQRWLQIVGAVGSISAVLYFARGVFYLWLFLLGLAIIVFVVWQLRSGGKRTLDGRGQMSGPVSGQSGQPGFAVVPPPGSVGLVDPRLVSGQGNSVGLPPANMPINRVATQYNHGAPVSNDPLRYQPEAAKLTADLEPASVTIQQARDALNLLKISWNDLPGNEVSLTYQSHQVWIFPTGPRGRVLCLHTKVNGDSLANFRARVLESANSWNLRSVFTHAYATDAPGGLLRIWLDSAIDLEGESSSNQLASQIKSFLDEAIIGSAHIGGQIPLVAGQAASLVSGRFPDDNFKRIVRAGN